MSRTNTTKEKIEKISFKMVRENGFSALNISELCEFAQITKPTFYYYFDSKEAIFLQQKIEFGVDDSMLLKVLNAENEWQKACTLVRGVFARLLEDYGKNVIQTILSLNMLNGVNPFCGNINTLLQFLSSFISKAQEAGIVRSKKSHKLLAEAIVKECQALLYMWASGTLNGDIFEIIFESLAVLCDVDDAQ